MPLYSNVALVSSVYLYYANLALFSIMPLYAYVALFTNK